MKKKDEKTITQEEILLSIINEEGNELILFNDNIHTFDYVIKALIEVCEMSYEQASTCANIAHYKGLCAIKHGSYDELRKMYNELVERNLKVDLR